MKKVVVVILAMLLCLSMLPLSVFADGSKAGGFDFYSITITYEEPVVVSYKKVASKDKKVIQKYNSKGEIVWGKGYIFAEPTDKIVLRAGDSISTALTFYEEDASAGPNLYEVVKDSAATSSVLYSKNPYKFGYLTSINDGAVVRTKSAVNFFGIMAIRDDAKEANPNLVYDEATGYAIAQEKDESGKNYLVDDNGYILDSNYIWHDSEGRRVEPFYQDEEGNLVWIPIKDRFDVKESDNDPKVHTGRILDTQDMGAKDSKGNAAGAELYRVVKDYNADGKYDATDFATAEYNDPNLVFTPDDILLDSNNHKVRGTPVIGTLQTKAKIKSITVELDALGSQIYSDAASDPQNKNTVTVSVLNTKDYIEAAVADGKQEGLGIGVILGTVNSKTTKTSAVFDKTTGETCVSIPLPITEDIISKLPETGLVYYQFGVQELQPDAAFSEDNIVPDEIVTEVKSEYKPEPTPIPEEKKGCGGFVAGSAIAVVTMLGACVLLKKKEER